MADLPVADAAAALIQNARRHQASSSSPLLLLLDGVLSQDEPSMVLALKQIRLIDPTLEDACNSPLRSSSTLELLVRRLLVSQPQLAQVSSETDGSSPLHFAASIGNIRVASWLLQQFPASALRHNKKGKIPLHYAAREGRIDMVRFLLQQVPQSAAVLTHKRKLPIHFAAGDGHVEVVRALLKANPEGASTPSKKGKVALHFAARWGHLAIAKDLFKVCPSCVTILDLDGNVPLHDAAREGQLEMAKFLVHEYPQGMNKSNIRGELPLFGAIRSGNVELCDFLIRSWPGSGKHVLRMVRPEDNVQSWDPAILDACLRGAVNNFFGTQQDQNATPTVAYDFSAVEQTNQPQVKERPARPKTLTVLDRGSSSGSSSGASKEVAAISAHAVNSRMSLHPSKERLTPGLDITLPRSKSPVLQEDDCDKKRSAAQGDITLPRSKSPVLQEDDCGKKRMAAQGTNSNKKSRRGSSMDGLGISGSEIIWQSQTSPTFFQLHAALECCVSCSVLECVLDRYACEQLTQLEDHGKLPLHLALDYCRQKEYVDLILDRIWHPHKQAAFCRDYLGRLPLHIALAAKADSRLIEVLLQENPSSGIDHCDAVDPKFGEKLPLQVASEIGCDLSTIFLLVKGDPTAVQSWNM